MGHPPKLALLLLAASLAWPAAAQDTNATATANVNVRSGPGTGYTRLSMIPAGAAVEIQNCDRAWCRIEHGGVTGFVSSRFLRRPASFAGSTYESGTNIAPPVDVQTTSPTYDPDRFRTRRAIQDYSDFRDIRRNRGYDGWTIPHLDMTSRRSAPRRF